MIPSEYTCSDPLTNLSLEQAFEYACQLAPVEAALAIIRNTLETRYCYHTEQHSRDVILEVLRFGKGDTITERDLVRLVIAAAWHDTGFLENKEDHEETSVHYFQKAQQQHSFPDLDTEDIEIIIQMIRDTKLFKTADGIVQIPTHPLSKYLLDADLSNLGRGDFFDCLDLLCMEHQAETYDFYRRTLGFITRHTWHTQVARELRLDQEIKNTTELARRILDERYLLSD